MSLSDLAAGPTLNVLVWLALAISAHAFRRLARRSQFGRRLDGAFTLIVTGLVFGSLAEVMRAAGPVAVQPYLDAAVLGALALGGVRVALTLFVDLYLKPRGGAGFSSIFLDVATVVAYFVVIFAVLHATLNINLASLVATSAVLTAIVGLALQDVLGNLFSGVVLEIEQSYTPGDWVRVGAFEGIVVETGWRTTKLRTRANELVILPNSALSKEAVVNYSRPDPRYCGVVRFEAAYDAPPNLVKAAALAVLDGEDGVVRSPRPEVRLDAYAESGVSYALLFWVSDFGQLPQIRNRILTNLWYALRRAGVRIPFPAREVFVHGVAEAPALSPGRDLVALMRDVPLLSALDEAALEQLAAGVQRLSFGKNETVIREGDVGDSFYVIESGQAVVTLENGTLPRVLGHLYPGSVFGEMSVLTGEPRSATIRAVTDLAVLVVPRDTFREVIASRPAVLEPLSEIAARRQVALEEQRRALTAAGPEDVERQQAQRLHERIKGFFRL
jgi:small-conductance mechanosensitive channel/CRP-like cAMP-binding protein